MHRFTLVDALTGEEVGERWSVWLGREAEGSFDAENEALATARRLVEQTGRDAWIGEQDGTWSRL